MPEQLPIQVDPFDGESGTGYCLRAVQRNGLNLHWLRRTAGIGYGKPLDARYAPGLAWIFGCTPGWLSHSLAGERRLSGKRRFGLAGELFPFRNQLRIREPQICPHCVHLDGLCRLNWDLALVTACPRHDCLLIDTCSYCKSLLRWDRPSIDLCRCGRPFERTNQSMSSEFPTALALSYLIKNWMDSSDKLGALTACQLPSWLGGLSLGGLLGIVHAFGSRASAYEPCSSWLTKRTARTSYWAQVADRAIDRLRATASGDVVEWKKLEPLVSKTLIEQVAFQSVDQGEQQVLRYLMGALYGEVLAGHMMGKLPEFSQIDFGWPHV